MPNSGLRRKLTIVGSGETSASGQFDPFRAPSGNDRYLRIPAGWSRRIADLADRGFGRLNWARKRTYSGRQGGLGVRPKPKLPFFPAPDNVNAKRK
jgi:hypothetical protein